MILLMSRPVINVFLYKFYLMLYIYLHCFDFGVILVLVL